MENELTMKSTKDVQCILSKVINDILDKDDQVLSKQDLEKANILLRVAKHSIQIFAVQLKYAEMRGLMKNKLKQLPEVK